MSISPANWVLFSYSVPKEPSTVRVALWRRLRQIGAMYIAPSVCMFPENSEGTMQLLACKQVAEEAGGSARLLPLAITNEFAGAELVQEFNKLRAAEYAEFRERAEALLDELRKEGARGKFTFAELEENEDELEKLERWLKRIEARDALDCSSRGPSVALLAQARQALTDFRDTTVRREVDAEAADPPRPPLTTAGLVIGGIGVSLPGWAIVALAVALIAIALLSVAAFVAWHKSETGTRELVRRLGKLSFRDKLTFGIRLIRHRDLPATARILVIILVIYLAMPIDLIPDFIPVLGHVDDVLVFLVIGGILVKIVPRDVIEEILGELEADKSSPTQLLVSLYRRWRLLADTGLVVLGIVAMKLAIDVAGLEFAQPSALFTSIVAGGIFLVSILLAGVLADYKESEKMPAEMAASIEAIYEEGRYVQQTKPDFQLAPLVSALRVILANIRGDLGSDESRGALAALSQLTPSFIEMEGLGVPPNYIVRLKQEQTLLRKNLLRIYHIQRTQFVPSAFTFLVVTIGLIIGVLLFTKIDPLYDALIVLAFVSFLFVYLVKLIHVIDTPFRANEHTLDDVSLFLFRELQERIDVKDTSRVRRSTGLDAHAESV